MPEVRVDLTIDAEVDEVWSMVRGVEAYPNYMANVRSVDILADHGDTRVTAWSVFLKGSILEWSESERIDDSLRRIEFSQLDGDLERFVGYWQVTADESGATRVVLDIDFEIGIPLLAQMLDPVAGRALRDNSEQMLHSLERKAIAG
jgi:ribosome-associated toxin RatA of RatAB toxin-antitoxin module